MENTLRQSDESQITACKIEREPDGTVLIRYVEAPAPWKKRLFIVFSIGSYLVAFLMLFVGLILVVTGDSPPGGITLIGFAIFIYWFLNTWAPKKWLFGSDGYGRGELRIVPDVGFKLPNGNLPFNDVQHYLNGYELLTNSHDVRAITNNGTHTIARCVTDLGLQALIASLEREGVLSSRTS